MTYDYLCHDFYTEQTYFCSIIWHHIFSKNRSAIIYTRNEGSTFYKKVVPYDTGKLFYIEPVQNTECNMLRFKGIVFESK